MSSLIVISRRVSAFLFLALGLCVLSGCDGFFDKTSSSSSSGTGNYVYVGNTGSNTISGYQLSTAGALTAVTSSPYSLSYTPQALAVTRSNSYLYVATSVGIYGYSIGSAGALTALASGAVLQQVAAAAMDTSPDGKWLITLNSDASSVTVFAIASDGTLAVQQTTLYSGLSGTPVPREIHVAANANYAYAAVGTGGTLIYTFNTSTGLLSLAGTLAPLSLTSDNSLVVDSSTAYLYLVRSGTTEGLTVYSIGTNGALTKVGSTYATGSQPYSVALGDAGKYVYAANRGDSTISGFVVGTSGALTSAPSSPYTAGSAVTALAQDSTDTWLIAAAYSGSPDVTVYGFDASNAGRVYTVSSIAAGTNPSLLALTH